MTFDIHTNRVPFGLLTEEEQRQLTEFEGGFEVYGGRFFPIIRPNWHPTDVYRAVRPAPTKPSINWDHIAPEFKWLARDENGEAFIYTRIPEVKNFSGETDVWSSDSDLRRVDEIFSSYTPGTCDWRDSLVIRPGYKGE